MIDNSGILLDKATQQEQGNWMLLWMLGLILFYMFIRLFYEKYWRRFRLAVIYPIEASKLLKEKNINLLQATISLNLAASLSVSLFLFLLVCYHSNWDWPEMRFSDMLLFTCLIMLLISLKYASVWLLGNIFKNKALAAEINGYWLINLKRGGFYLLLCSMVLNYIPGKFDIFPIVVGALIIGIMLIINTLRSIGLLRQYRVSLFYGILYLCTLEILPVVMIVGIVFI